MKAALFIVTVFLIQFINARPKVTESFETPDGHMYKVELDRNGKEIISRDDEDGEITIALHEQRKWVVILSSDNATCYVIDMTEKEIQAKATDLDFETEDYEMKTVHEEVETEVKATCEKYGGKGRDIVQLGPKEPTDNVPATFQGGKAGRIVKRSWCIVRRCRIYRIIIRGRIYVFIRCWYYIRRC